MPTARRLVPAGGSVWPRLPAMRHWSRGGKGLRCPVFLRRWFSIREFSLRAWGRVCQTSARATRVGSFPSNPFPARIAGCRHTARGLARLDPHLMRLHPSFSFAIGVASLVAFASVASAARFDTPTLTITEESRTSVTLRVEAGPTGAPSGFTLVWMKRADYVARGGWANPGQPGG